MLRAWKFFWVALWTILIGSLLTKNIVKYKEKPILWNMGKTCLDSIIIIVSAVYLPVFLVGIDGSWIASHFQNKWYKMLIGIVSGIALGVVSVYCMELVIILSIFGIDSKTGPEEGIIKRWNDVKYSDETGESIAA